VETMRWAARLTLLAFGANACHDSTVAGTDRGDASVEDVADATPGAGGGAECADASSGALSPPGQVLSDGSDPFGPDACRGGPLGYRQGYWFQAGTTGILTCNSGWQKCRCEASAWNCSLIRVGDAGP
jgi:hypothetical protein